jgi:CRP-like cAMP-binding protein
MPVTQKNYIPGEILFKEGDVSHAIYIIKRGAVSIRKQKGQSFVEVGKVQSGEVVGELSFFDHLPRSATAVALTEVELLEVPFEALETVYNNIPHYLKTIIASLAERLRQANVQIQRLQKTLPNP